MALRASLYSVSIANTSIEPLRRIGSTHLIGQHVASFIVKGQSIFFRMKVSRFFSPISPAAGEAMKHLNIDPKNSVAAIQGFGNVAQYASIGFVEILGGKVACVSCWDRNNKKAYTYSHKDGVNGRFLLSITDISVLVVSKPQNADQSLTTSPPPITSLPRLMVPATSGT